MQMMAHFRQPPKVEVIIEGERVRDLVDTGCTTTMVRTRLVTGWSGSSRVVAFDGRGVKCRGMSNVNLELDGQELNLKVIVTDRLVPGIDAIIGIDAIFSTCHP